MNNIEKWHEIMRDKKLDALDDLLAKDVTFYSPVVFKGQEGRTITSLYLMSAYEMFFADNNQSFRYVRELNDENNSILEFTCTIAGIEVNGVDMIRWNSEGKIQEFKVMVRPYKAIELVKAKMFELLNNVGTMDSMKLKMKSLVDKFVP